MNRKGLYGFEIAPHLLCQGCNLTHYSECKYFYHYYTELEIEDGMNYPTSYYAVVCLSCYLALNDNNPVFIAEVVRKLLNWQK